MKKPPSPMAFFQPIDDIAVKLIGTLDEITDKEVRNFRLKFLESYPNNREIHPKQKEWRRVLTQSPVPALDMAAIPQYKEFDSEIQPGGNGEFAGVADIDESHIEYWINKEFKAQDVHLCHLDKAISDGFIHNLFLNKISNEIINDRFSILAHGASNHSLYLSIPDKVNVKSPFLIRINSSRQPVLFPILINIFIGKQSSAKVILKFDSSIDANCQSVIPVSLNVFADELSEFDLVEDQRFNMKTLYFANQKLMIGAGASISSLLIERGSELVKRNMSIELEGEGADANITGLYTMTGSQKFIFDTSQNHMASRTSSDLLFKGVLDGSAYSLWKGNVFVAAGTHGADGFQMNNNIMLAPSAQAESIPGLEINADNVKCSHGVTISDIDPDQLYYLESRGIDQKIGIDLIVDGFVRAALQRINKPEIKSYAMNALNFEGDF